jgi:hypothetical protein
MVFESSKLTTLPAIPKTKQNTKRLERFKSTPFDAKYPSKPKRLKVMLATSTMARLVKRNNAIRNM